MIKLKTGVSTSLDFVKAMKERGQDVSPAFPAATLRDQLDALSDEVKVTFKSDNETVLQVVNDYEDPVFNLTIKYGDAPLSNGLVPVYAMPGGLEFNEEMVTIEAGVVRFGEHALIKANGITLADADYSIAVEDQMLILEGPTLQEIWSNNGGTFEGVVFDMHIDAGVATKDNKSSAEFNKVFTYGESVDGSNYPIFQWESNTSSDKVIFKNSCTIPQAVYSSALEVLQEIHSDVVHLYNEGIEPEGYAYNIMINLETEGITVTVENVANVKVVEYTDALDGNFIGDASAELIETTSLPVHLVPNSEDNGLVAFVANFLKTY